MAFNFNQFASKQDETMQTSIMKMLEGCNTDLLSLLSTPSGGNMLGFGQDTTIVDDTNRMLANLISGSKNPNSIEGYEIFITDLPPETTEMELIVLFQQHGPLIKCTLNPNYRGKKHAYICYANEQDAKTAINKMDRAKMGRSTIQVRWSNRNSKKYENISNSTQQPEKSNSKEQHNNEIKNSPFEGPRKRAKSDLEVTVENPLYKSPPKEKEFKNKMSEGLLKISELQDESEKSDEEVKCIEADENISAAKSRPTTPKAAASSNASSDVEDQEVQNSTPPTTLRGAEQLVKELDKLKSRVLTLETEKNNENQLQEAEMNKLKAQVEAANKKSEELEQKIEELKNKKVPETPSMEDFEILKGKVESLEQENRDDGIKTDEKTVKAKVEKKDNKAADDENKAKSGNEATEIDTKSKDEKNLSDIDVCILTLSQTINEHFKNLAGKLMSGQKEKEEELMMERLRSLEPIQAVIYEKLRWILSIGGNPANEGALRSVSKVSKHFPFLLAFLGFNYNDLIMMSIGMDKEISQAEGAIRLAKWFNYIMQEKVHTNKKIWPSSLSPNMLASILTEHFFVSSKQKPNLKPMNQNISTSTLNPLVLPNAEKIPKQLRRPRKDNDISIVGEVSQSNNTGNKSFQPSKGIHSNTGAMYTTPPPPFPSLVDMRTLGMNKKRDNQAALKGSFSRQNGKDSRWPY